MIQGFVKMVDKDHQKAVVRTEYDDLVVMRVLDGTKIDTGDTIVGALDCQGENFVLNHSKKSGMQVVIENGHRLFAGVRNSSGRRNGSSGHSSARKHEGLAGIRLYRSGESRVQKEEQQGVARR